MSKEYRESVDWSKIKCKNHSDRQAVIQFNPPIGSFFCKECWKELERLRICRY